MAEDLKSRDNKAVVAAINTALAIKCQAVAITWLQSGNHIVTFAEGAQEWYAENIA